MVILESDLNLWEAESQPDAVRLCEDLVILGGVVLSTERIEETLRVNGAVFFDLATLWPLGLAVCGNTGSRSAHLIAG